MTRSAAALAANAAVPGEGEEPSSMDHWRSEAFAMLADPAAVLAFLRGDEPAPTPTSSTATVFVHVSADPDADDADTLGPVARVEGMGPMLLSQVRDLLRGHHTVNLTPVVDLHADAPSTATSTPLT